MNDLTWKGRDALRVFEGSNSRPGEGLSPTIFVHHMGGKGSVAVEGIRELAEKGYASIENGETNIVLTDAGYEAIRAGAAA